MHGASLQKKNNMQPESTTLLQAVFVYRNYVILPKLATGDATPEQSLLRHNSLYNLGYRLLSSPYAQPSLTTDDVDGSFDDIMILLSYFPFDEQTVRIARNAGEYSIPSQQKAMTKY